MRSEIDLLATLVLATGIAWYSARHEAEPPLPTPGSGSAAVKEYNPPAQTPPPPLEPAPKKHHKKSCTRLIGDERVPCDHTPDDHDWDEFLHSKDECHDAFGRPY